MKEKTETLKDFSDRAKTGGWNFTRLRGTSTITISLLSMRKDIKNLRLCENGWQQNPIHILWGA